ncbi:MAG: prolyl oligopeptidase family serine peptidase [Porticoccaceae bacterium]|nr:prolyl oligopeptidase family serine peptidase [Porticoccaceae bacterium]
MKKTAPYGSWPSPITAKMIASATPTIDLPNLDQGQDQESGGDSNNRKIYWLESRPDEGGRNTIVCRNSDGSQQDVLPSSYSARSRVHEYGGACYIVIDDVLYFVAQDDQRIYRFELSEADNNDKCEPLAITPADSGYRFADLSYDQNHNRVLCVCEQHFEQDSLEQSNPEQTRDPRNFIAGVSLSAPYGLTELVSGADFYAYPRIKPLSTLRTNPYPNSCTNPEHEQLCWLSWDHPSMPWYSTKLWLGSVDESGAVSQQKHIAGSADEAIFQPQWSPTGQLYFISDRSQWWNLYRYEASQEGAWESSGEIIPICPMEAEFATPLWTLGMSTYAFVDGDNPGSTKIATCYTQNGLWHLGLVDVDAHVDNRELTPVESSFTQLSAMTGRNSLAWFVAASADTGNQLIQLSVDTGLCQVINELPQTDTATPPSLDKNLFSQAQALSFTSSHGDQAHAFYYSPHNLTYRGPVDDKPPLIVICHGGPTGATSAALNLKIQFWTSRGFAVLDINYRGSTGYGRHYRELLDGKWGLSDVGDVVAGAKYLIKQGLVDPNKLAIRGSSAGGYTVLAALTFHDVFKAGASYYGIGDLETLARDTHKFESKYLERLVGAYPAETELYQARSPVNHIEKLTCPVIFFQGLDDKVVPPDQAQAMILALEKQKLPCDYVPFRGEGHGFRKAENIAHALDQELQFYSKIFGFKLPANQT